MNLCFVLLVCFSINSCLTTQKRHLSLSPAQLIDLYEFDSKSNLRSRINGNSKLIKSYLSDFDSRQYKIYTPSERELKQIESAYNILPAKIKSVFDERVVGLVFIKDFLSSGFTEWILNSKNNKIFSFIAIDSRVLLKKADALLEYRENSCFIKKSSNLKIQFKMTNAPNAIDYIFLHEMAHVYDYVHNVTPYVDTGYKKFITLKPFTENLFSNKVWLDYRKTTKDISIFNKKNITFYGFSQGPKIKIQKASSIYASLHNTPFVNLYATSQWSEDFAEAITFSYFENVLNIRTQILLKDAKSHQIKLLLSVNNMLQKASQARKELINKIIY